MAVGSIDAEQCISNALILAIIAPWIAVWRSPIRLGLGFGLL
jgi:hypothetical protein